MELDGELAIGSFDFLTGSVSFDAEHFVVIAFLSSHFESCHPELSEAESKDPVARPCDNVTGFLDFARNDNAHYFAGPLETTTRAGRSRRSLNR